MFMKYYMYMYLAVSLLGEFNRVGTSGMKHCSCSFRWRYDMEIYMYVEPPRYKS